MVGPACWGDWVAGRAACPSATGMNLSSGLEDVPGLFWPTVQASLGAGAVLAVVMYSYYKVRKQGRELADSDAPPRGAAGSAGAGVPTRRCPCPLPCHAMQVGPQWRYRARRREIDTIRCVMVPAARAARASAHPLATPASF